MIELLQELLSAVITVAIPIIVVYFVRFVRGKIKEITTDIENDKVASHLERAAEIVLQAVTSVMQTYVDALKKAGSFDREAHIEAFSMAREIANTLINAAIRKTITDVHGDFALWLETKIEQCVNQTKIIGY